MSKVIRIDVVSDSVCPWCYIGKRRLESAIKSWKASNKGGEVQVTWHPYQLNPQASKEGVNKLEFYKEKFGQRAVSLMATMTETFAQEGLQYNIDGMTGNTLDSHRLIAHAAKEGPERQNALVEGLFKAYFTEGKFINDRAVLLEAAENAGLKDAKSVLDDETVERDRVKEEIAGTRGTVNGVPHFTINGQYQLSGAQDPSAFVKIFNKF